VTPTLPSILPVWLLVIVGAVLVGVLSPRDQYFQWLSIVLASATILTFVIQLAVSQKEGLVLRIMAALAGSVIILGVATAILALVRA
jgi:hypothetical protein